MRTSYALPSLLVVVLVASACGGGNDGGRADDAHGGTATEATDGADGGGAGDGASDEGDASTDTAAVPTRDVGAEERANLTPGGELRLALSSFAENWNPRHIDGNNASYTRLRQPLLPVFFDYDERGTPTPNPDYLLSAEVVEEEPTVIRYRINPEAVWGDGSPVDGDDMRAVWQACNGEDTRFNCASTENLSSIESITTGEDRREVTVTYESAFPDWTQTFSIPGVLKAESVADPDIFNEGWGELRNDWLSGPFAVDGFDETQKVMTLVPNDRWWGEPPLLERIVWREIALDATAQAFANGEIDAFDIGADPDAYQRASRVTDAEVRKAGGPNFRHFTFNSKAGLLTERAVRQAIVHALDRESIAASDLAGIDWPAVPLNNHVFLQGQEGYVDTAAATGLDYDPDKARALLEEAGWTPGADGIREKDGEKLVVRFTQIATVKASENEALQARAQLEEVGIRLDIVTIPVARFGPTLVAGEFELIAFSWIGTPYPFSGLVQLYGTGSESNYARLSMPEVDELAARIATETDPAERIRLANEADAIIWTAVHTLPLYQRPELVATRANLANYGALGLSSLRWEDIGYRR